MGPAFSGTPGFHGVGAFYESNSNGGSIVSINLTKKSACTIDIIATGFGVNHGVPGAILGPSGLTYAPKRDVLYIVDGNMDRVVGFNAPGMVAEQGIVVNGSGFSGSVGGVGLRPARRCATRGSAGLRALVQWESGRR